MSRNVLLTSSFTSRSNHAKLPALRIEVTTEDGELLESVTVNVTDDPFYPVGRGPSKAALLAEIEAAARTLQTRARHDY